MSLLKEFIKNIQQQNLFQKNDYLLLAVSGGADSVALCELCHQAGFHFAIAHCNFQLRGEESERDEKFVRELAEKYGVKIFVKKFETQKYAEEQKRSIQETARSIRYAWFLKVWAEWKGSVESEGAPQNSVPGWHVSKNPWRYYVATAHHANDNVETLLINFFKGTGIKGVRGISPKSGLFNHLVRPLLFATREEIISFIKENNLSFVEDSSNASDKYTRNYFRHQLIPAIQKVFPQVEENLINNIERFKDVEVLYQQSIDLHKKKLLEQKGNEIHIPVLKLLKSTPLKTIMYEIIKDFGFTPHQTEEVLALLHAESGKYISSSTHKIIRNRNWLIIAPNNTLEANHILINESDTAVDFELGKLKLKRYQNGNEKLPGSKEIATLDLKNITFRLLLRKWKQGDYFYPLGMKGKKKLSKFFIDQKLSLTDKEKIWVIESNKKIIWVIGQRIDDRFKITDKTKEVLSISFSK